MPFWEAQRCIIRHSTQDGRMIGCFTQEFEMALAAHAIAYQPGQADLRIEVGKPASNRGNRSRHSGSVDHQQHRRAEPFRDLRRRTIFAARGGPVEQTHHAFNDRDVGAGGGPRKSAEHRVTSHHPAVQVMRGLARRAHMVGRVEIIGTAFENRNLKSTRTQRANKSDRKSSLSGAAFRAGYDHPCNGDLV
jgi:hypothetical protein